MVRSYPFTQQIVPICLSVCVSIHLCLAECLYTLCFYTFISVSICSSMSITILLYICAFIASDSLQPHGLPPGKLFCPWDFPGKNTGVDCHFLFRGIFPTQESNPNLLCLLHWQADFFFFNHCTTSEALCLYAHI